MNYRFVNTSLLKLALASGVLLLVNGLAMADSLITLTAAPTSATLPDGQTVPMWGYTCSAVSGDGVSCTAANGQPQTSGWQPPLLRVPSDQLLKITLVNNLYAKVPTSLVVVGQLGGGLGDVASRTTMPSPTHNPQGTTWPGTLGTTGPGDPVFTPPKQADRVRSFSTEVNTTDVGGKVLTWSNLRPGTYLIESGTEPSIQGPMGLYGILVVTDSSTPGTAYGTSFDQDVPLLLSEIDPVQNMEVAQVVQNAGFSDTAVWSGKAGACGDISQPAAAHTCYPPAVNYSPLYYLINGVSFDRSNAAASSLAIPNTAGPQKKVLLRLVNAGLRMHVPSVVGSTMTLLAEDGNKLPGLAKVQSEVFMAAGKSYDVTIQPKQSVSGTYDAATYAIFDRALSLSANNQHDGGMQAYINVAGGAAPENQNAVARDDAYSQLIADSVLAVAERAKGVLANDTGVYGVTLLQAPAHGTVTLNPDGTFTYTPSGVVTSDSFTYCANGSVSGTTCSTNLTATVTLGACTGTCLGGAPTAGSGSFVSNVASQLKVSAPGVLAYAVNPSGLPLTATPPKTASSSCGSLTLNADGSFVATPTSVPSGNATISCSFNYNVATSTKQTSTADGTITVTFNGGNGMSFNVQDAKNNKPIDDYRWIIEEDRTFWIDPKCQVNSTQTAAQRIANGCAPLPVESLGYNFHTANMPVIAQGCVGAVSCESGQTINGGTPTACDVGNGICPTDGSKSQKVASMPGDVHLDPNKHYFISILPGDGVNPTVGGAGGPDDSGKPFTIAAACGDYDSAQPAWVPAGAAAMCGHAMGGSQIAPGQTTVNIKLQQTPLPTAKLSVFVFRDDNPLNGENDAGGGVDIIAPNEPGLGGFQIELFDQAGGLGDNTGQITYNEFNMPLSNALANKIDPVTGLDACPINSRGDGIVGMVATCPTYESDGKTLSPLAGQVVIDNLYPGLYEVQAYPSADRIARGEEWLQTNTLDGGKPHEAFLKPNEPGYFQEFGPGGYHVAIGFANPAIINGRKGSNGDGKSLVCSNQACNSSLTVRVTNNHMSRTPDQRTFSSETYDHYSFTQCYISVGAADAEDFAIQKCPAPDADGKVSVTFDHMPDGVFKLTVFDQWNDIMLDGLVGSVSVHGNTVKDFPVTQWRTNLYTRTYLDQNGDGIAEKEEPGLALVNTNIRYRDGSIGFFNNTDLNGYAGFNEVFPFMNWLVVDTSSTRFKPTRVHTVYDAGGTVDCSVQAGGRCTNTAAHIANTDVRVALPADLRVPGAKYCATADCLSGDAGNGLSTGTLFPAQPWGTTMGWQGLLGQNTFIEFGLKPFQANENGGIAGDVIYASTRPFDDPTLSLQLSWEPGVPRVKVNLYQKTVDTNGIEHLTLVDNTTTTSWDDWAQGFRRDANGNLMTRADGSYIPNMNCPGQDDTSPFFATLQNSKQWLDTPDATGNKKTLAYKSQFKCYDGWSQLNQVQPAPYDGRYKFPSVVTVDPVTGKPAKTNCTICTGTDSDGNPMLPAGKYVVEVVVPSGYELVKEEDKNILLGDVYIAPVTQQFAGLGNVFIMPDQAAVAAHYNPNSPGSLNLTNNLGASPRHEGDTGSVEAFWPCVGAERIVPDLNSLFPDAGQAAPFAGAKRRLCDRKEVTLQNEAAALAKFFVFSSTHIAGHFTGTITNDFASEFDPFSPQFGEKFGPPNLPVGLRDFTGNEVARVYSDQWGIYNGLYFSSYSVNPPNPTGYVPQMSIACMNDPGPIVDPATGQMITDPSYNPAYSNFCYEQPFMPGFTTYMDTPVIPTQAFADGYNLPDTEYPDGTPAIKSVTSSAAPGPWVRQAISAAAATGTITFTGVSNNDVVNSVVAGADTLTGGAITCNSANACSNLNGNGRNNRMATLVANSIAARAGTTGVTATANNNTVTLTATATGTTLNGVTVVVNQVGITVGGTLAFAGGSDASAASLALTINALGDKVVQNPNFSGPNATVAPFNQKTITRHYGFGTAGTVALVGADGASHPLTGVTWSDTQITGTVNANDLPPACTVQQRGQATARCGELVITRTDNGKQSIDAITVTIGGSAPWIVTPNAVTPPAGKTVFDYSANFGRLGFSPIQTAIDSADSGDLILVQPGTYRENLIMWKPVRLQGVGAGSVTINADAHPAGKMDQWRRQVDCVFGLDLEGIPNLNDAAFDKGGTYSCPAAMHQRVDRIQFEAITGWDASGNGNLAQVLQEPTLMGAYEGAGITVLGRGIRIPANSNDFWGADPAAAGAFPAGAVYLGSGSRDCSTASTTLVNGRDYGTSNFYCNPSRIDGVSIINSSQGGGGLFIHGWAQSLEVANNRISGNHGTLAGAINLGNGETPSVYLNDGTICGTPTTTDTCPPIPGGTPTNGAIPFQWNTNVRIHHNMIYNNASIGDALFTGTPAGAGGITVSAGADGYRIDHNWIAGNLSTGDGGGLQQLGVSFNSRISSNYILFNQSTNPTLPTNGGGVIIEAANEPRMLNGVECGTTTDQDCPPGLGEGTGPGLVIDANLILGNSAESGSGGGLRLQQINGTEIGFFPRQNSQWYGVTVTNNIIANNVAGWDGGGVSLQDALKVSFINNTVVSNDTTASAGSLFKTLGAINAASPPPGCKPVTDPNAPQDPGCLGVDAPHGPQPAGLVVMAHTSNLVEAINAIPNGPLGVKILCPTTYGYSGVLGVNGDCTKLSKPQMVNDLFWQNRSFSVDITGMGTGNQSQQNLIALSPLLNQGATGECAAGAHYWDIGLRTDDITAGDITTANKLTLSNSIVTGDPQAVLTQTNPVGTPSSPVVAQFCNGARTAPESCDQLASGLGQSCHGFNAPAGASETTSLAQVFVFNGIQPTATVDEGHNWLNLTYGPLTLNRSVLLNQTNASAPELMIASASVGVTGGAYSLPGTSAAVNGGTNTGAPATDFFGNSRARTNANPADVGAVECQTNCVGVTIAVVNITGGPLDFGDVANGQTSAGKQLVLHNTGNGALTGIGLTFSGRFSRPSGTAGGNCGTTLAAGATCTINVVFSPNAIGTVTGSLAIAGNVSVTGSPVSLNGNGVAPTVSATFAPATWTPTQTRNCPGTTFAQRAACLLDPTQSFTLTNTGNVTLTGVSTGSLTGANTADYTIVTLGSTCGTNTFLGNFTSLAPGATCTVTVAFRPLTSEAAGAKAATVRVNTAAGFQSAALTGTAN